MQQTYPLNPSSRPRSHKGRAKPRPGDSDEAQLIGSQGLAPHWSRHLTAEAQLDREMQGSLLHVACVPTRAESSTWVPATPGRCRDFGQSVSSVSKPLCCIYLFIYTLCISTRPWDSAGGGFRGTFVTRWVQRWERRDSSSGYGDRHF